MKGPRIGMALGSGSARGWAHIGILRALEELGIRPDVVTGASVGALVAAAYASRQLDLLEHWVRELTRMEVWRLVDATLRGGGVMRGDRLMGAIAEQIRNEAIEDLPIAFAAVATDLETGHEVWLREGPMLSAVRASSGLPGLFSPLWYQNRWLIDGGLVNPVPVSLCRALGADYVIAVDLNTHFLKYVEFKGKHDSPGMFDVIATSISIMQDRITRSRMVGDPPAVLLTPRVGHFQLMDFHRAAEAIELGRGAVERALDDLCEFRKLLG